MSKQERSSSEAHMIVQEIKSCRAQLERIEGRIFDEILEKLAAPRPGASEFDGFLTTDEIAQWLHIDRRKVTSWCRSGELAAMKLGKRWLVEPKDFREWVEKAKSRGRRWRVSGKRRRENATNG